MRSGLRLLLGSILLSGLNVHAQASHQPPLHSFEELIQIVETSLVSPGALGYLATSIERLANQEPNSPRGRRYRILAEDTKRSYEELMDGRRSLNDTLTLVHEAYRKLLGVRESCAAAFGEK